MADYSEVICIGETMLMLAPPQYELLEEASSYRVMVGGAESNVAIGLQRLGVRSGWIGKLPDNPLGHRVAASIKAQGVDTTNIIWDGDRRLGLFFFQWGSEPRDHVTIYDREHSAASAISSNEINWDYVLNSKWLHITGITPALSEECYQFTKDLVDRAGQSKVKISFDINYRSQLWDRITAVKVFEEILPKVDLIIGTNEDIRMLLGGNYSTEEALTLCYQKYHPQVLAITCGAEGACAFDGKEAIQSGGHDVHMINRLGAGDAFAAGLLSGLLE
jgi:2-dehydro-3-deoxygluconokinase